MSITTFLKNTCETRESHADPELRTRYYRNNFTQCLEAVKKLAARDHLDVRDINSTHGEIFVIGPSFDSIITVCQINPIESGIDLKVNLASSLGWGRPKKIAVSMFHFFDANLQFKGVSLHP